jgi:predicted NUDIX family phosphoesterase
MDADGWYGIRTDRVASIVQLITSHGRFEPRDAMERDPAYKQVIPYVVLRDGDRYFLMKRTRSGGDPRLHDRYSIGVGGHLNPGDGDVDGGLRREWREELDADFVPDFTLVGALNDDTTDVGRVHLGLVYVADAAGRRVEIRETDKLTGRFADAVEVARVADDLETWSRIVFEELEGAVR